MKPELFDSKNPSFCVKDSHLILKGTVIHLRHLDSDRQSFFYCKGLIAKDLWSELFELAKHGYDFYYLRLYIRKALGIKEEL